MRSKTYVFGGPSGGHRRLPTRLGTVVVAVLAAVTVASCSSGTSGKSQPATSTAAASASQSSKANAAQPLVRTIGKTGWWDGFAITVDKATLTPNTVGGGGSLSLDVTYKNLTEQNGAPSTNSFLKVGDQVVTPESDAPTVPGSGTTKATITANLTGTSTDLAALLDSAELIYGQASDNQTKIPLSTSGKVDSIAPKTLTVTGKLVQDQIDIDVLSGTLAPSYKSGEKNKMTLDLRIKLTCGPQCAESGYNIGRDEFSVRATEGTSVVADSRSPYCCDALYPSTVSDNAKNVVVFLVPTPGTGKYVLTYNNTKLTDAGTPPATLEFTA